MAKRILFQGDSITDCGRDRNSFYGTGNGYPCFVKGSLGMDCPGEYEFINRGISGNRIVDVYARIKKDIINLKPDYLSILIGVNDVWHEISEHNGVSAEKFRMVYDLLIRELKEALPELKILILEPFVLEGPATKHAIDTFTTEVAKRAAVCKELAEEHGLIFIPLQKKLEALAQATSNTYVLIDGVHPNIAGHELISRELYAAYSKIL